MLNFISVINFVYVFIWSLPALVYFLLWNMAGEIAMSDTMRHYSMRVLVGIDQSWNAALRGEEDETVSSRLGRAMVSGRPKWGAKMFAYFVDFIFYITVRDKNHCISNIDERFANGAPSDEKWSFIREKN